MTPHRSLPYNCTLTLVARSLPSPTIPHLCVPNPNHNPAISFISNPEPHYTTLRFTRSGVLPIQSDCKSLKFVLVSARTIPSHELYPTHAHIPSHELYPTQAHIPSHELYPTHDHIPSHELYPTQAHIPIIWSKPQAPNLQKLRIRIQIMRMI